MQNVKFSFKLTAKGKLANVFFFPENSDHTIRIETKDFKIWENEEFELEVNNPFEYKLRVYGATGTDWEAILNITDDNDESKEFIKWKGTTGDLSANTSERTNPVKNLPSQLSV